MNKGFLDFMFITNNLEIAKVAQDTGVKRVWVDLEILGKEQRQPGMNTVKSGHTLEDVSAIRSVLTKSELLVRVNSLYEDSEQEINEVIDRGADMIMLPYFKTVDDVDRFLKIVRGRVKTTLLFESKESVENIDVILSHGGFDEAHIGLNDLHLSYGMTFMFELLSNGMVEAICNKFKAVGIPYGFGGIAKIGEGLLPAEKVIAEHYRLGSTRAILSRSFCDTQFNNDFNIWKREFQLGVNQIRLYESLLPMLPESYIQENIDDVKKGVDKVVEIIKTRGNAN
ncbi:MAG: aldolase [Bacteroidales bacterium]|nr:aldolase [Bacteroidales bacterium]MCF0190037.1 aldolase [Marinilabiliaceae bacterium]